VKVLYLTDAYPDYLSDDLLYGLRSILGSNVVDYPRKDVLYRTSVLKTVAHGFHGRGFHCFGLDDAIPVDRTDIATKVCTGYFDVVINSSAWRIDCPSHPQLVVMDGEDHGELMPKYVGNVPLYFKRELFTLRQTVEPLLFALPDFLVDDNHVLPRTKRYHASFSLNTDIRRELTARFAVQNGFLSWDDYAADMRNSWFAISPRGGGYDCQRHYEILGRAVLCIFIDGRAPSMLREYFIDNRNCLTFASVPELLDKLDHCADPQRLIDQARIDLSAHHLASKRAEQMMAIIARYDIGHRRLSVGARGEWRRWLRLSVAEHARDLAVST
jgi:hypothetical protein